MATINLEATVRNPEETKAAVLRSQLTIPAVIYGNGVETRSLSIAESAFRTAYAEAGMSSLVDVIVDGAAPVKAVIKDVQVNPLTMKPIHVDFHQVNMKEKMYAEVPLVFDGESEAVKALGGTLVTPIEHVEVACLPSDLPHDIHVDIGALHTFDDAVTVADLKLPKGVEVTNDAGSTIAFVDAPLSEEELKKMEESQVGDVSEVKAEGEEEKKEEEGAAEEAKTEGNEA